MPTMPKVFAAVFFAALGYLCGDLVKPLLPEGTRVAMLSPTVAALGFLSGWFMSGARAGDSLRSGFGYGLTSAALTVFWSIFFFAGAEALDRSMNRRYGGPMDAIMGMVELGMEYTLLIATPGIIGTLIVGGLFGGWLVEWSAKRWN
ncbi:MAG: TrgA family protein [Paracoccaceae bacterium]